MGSRKRKIGTTSEYDMKQALVEYFDTGLGLKTLAEKYSIPRTTLRRYRDKCLKTNIRCEVGKPPDEDNFPRLTPNYEVNKIFTADEEATLGSYLKTMAKLQHGLTPKHVRGLAYQLAIAHNKKIPDSWHSNSQAGKLWFTGFMKRNKDVSIRKPESTAINRAMGFNKPVVMKFFENLERLLTKYKFRASDIYNVDETALTTVQETNKVIAEKGQKQVGQITSAERGQLVTMVGCINAAGNSVPPMLIFPRKYLKQHMMKGSPPGSVGDANPSGWINGGIFKNWMIHFISHIKPTEDLPVLLIMDNHESHITYETIRFAKENHVKLLTLPPHTSHKLQPLDKSVYGPLKTFYNDECRKFLLNHPGARITIYEIAEILGHAYPQAVTPKNCISAFANTGICPFNRDIYGDADFLAASVTDVPSDVPQLQPKDHQELLEEATIPSPQAGSSKMVDAETGVTNTDSITTYYFSPEAILPFPKVEDRKQTTNRKARQKKSTEILTDTPFMEKLRLEESAKLAKVKKVTKKVFPLRQFQSVYKIKKRQATKPSKIEESDSEDSLSVKSFSSTTSSENFHHDQDYLDDLIIQNLSIDSFILVQFPTKKTVKHYIGKILSVEEPGEEYTVSFLRKKNNKFVFPVVPDISTIASRDIVMKLPSPFDVGGTQRTAHSFAFPLDLSHYKVQ